MVFTVKGASFSYKLWTEITLPSTEKKYLVERIVYLIIYKARENHITNDKNGKKINIDSIAADAV